MSSESSRPSSIVLNSYVKVVFFFILIFTLYLFLKGHNEPGGGFIAGVAFAISFIMLNLALGVERLQKLVRIDLVWFAVLGLILAYGTSLAPVLLGYPFLYHKMIHLHVPLLGDFHVGTPLLFDLGVFFVVVGVTSKMALILSEAVSQEEPEDAA